jgi:hypothetical protein
VVSGLLERWNAGDYGTGEPGDVDIDFAVYEVAGHAVWAMPRRRRADVPAAAGLLRNEGGAA